MGALPELRERNVDRARQVALVPPTARARSPAARRCSARCRSAWRSRRAPACRSATVAVGRPARRAGQHPTLDVARHLLVAHARHSAARPARSHSRSSASGVSSQISTTAAPGCAGRPARLANCASSSGRFTAPQTCAMLKSTRLRVSTHHMPRFHRCAAWRGLGSSGRGPPHSIWAVPSLFSDLIKRKLAGCCGRLVATASTKAASEGACSAAFGAALLPRSW